MSFPCLTKIWSVVICTIWLVGCAGTQPAQVSDGNAGELSGDDLDLLFATEFPVASKNEAIMKATQAYRDGEPDKALFYLIRALKFDFTDTNVLTQIGNLHVRQGNSKLAGRAYQFALGQEPQHAAAHEGLGMLYFKAGNDKMAREHLEAALASEPNLWRAHNALGVIDDREDNFASAQRHYDAALEIQPLADSILINRGYSKYLMKDYRAAALDFFTVTERSDNEKAWRNLGMVYAKQGWYEDALETFLHIGEERDAYNETGVIAMENGDDEEAFHYLSEAVRLSPTYFAQAEKNLAQLRKKSSNDYAKLN